MTKYVPEFEKDYRTNLPRVPEGYYWRVHAGWSEIYSNVLYVNLMKKRDYWFDKSVCHTSYTPEWYYSGERPDPFADFDTIEDIVYSLAEDVMLLKERELAKVQAHKETLERFKSVEGDYPPKIL